MVAGLQALISGGDPCGPLLPPLSMVGQDRQGPNAEIV